MVVFFVAQDGAGAIYLFCEEQPDQLVRQGELREGPSVVRPGENGLVQAVCAADEEDQIFVAFVGAVLDKLGESFGGHLASAFVECDQIIILCQLCEDGFGFLFLLYGGAGAGFWRGEDEPFHLVIAADAAGEIFDAGFYVGFVFFADRPELEFHECVVMGVFSWAVKFTCSKGRANFQYRIVRMSRIDDEALPNRVDEYVHLFQWQGPQ